MLQFSFGRPFLVRKPNSITTMNTLHRLFAAGALAFVLPFSGFGAETAPVSSSAPAKAIGMYSRVDSIDAAGKTFTHRNADGKVVKFVVTDRTEIKNSDKPATLGDIKVGDTVSGSRIKKSDTEYQVVKITKFGVATPKAKKSDAVAAVSKGNR